MPTDPLQLTLAVLETAVLFGGAGLGVWLVVTPRQRQRWLGTHPLPQISLSVPEFALAGVLIFLGGFAFSTVAQMLVTHFLAPSADQKGLQLVILNVANYGGALAGWRLLVPIQNWGDGNRVPPARPTRPPLPWSEATGYAIGTLVVALPIVILVNLAWVELLRLCGLPDDPQDILALFTQTKSAPVVAGLLLIACVFAPVFEELLFRAGLYRYLRQKLGRTPALLISGIGFGALHANWASLLPLAVLGMLLALVYEATGSIRVAIIAHGLFNLNNLILLLSGLIPANQ